MHLPRSAAQLPRGSFKLELGLIGDYLAGSFSAHPLPPKGERGVGLRPENFSDPAVRAAYEVAVLARNYAPHHPLDLRTEVGRFEQVV